MTSRSVDDGAERVHEGSVHAEQLSNQSNDLTKVVERLRSRSRVGGMKLLSEAADAIEALLSTVRRLTDERDEAVSEAAMASIYCAICGSCGSDGCGCEHKCKFSTSHPDVIAAKEAADARIAELEAVLRRIEGLNPPTSHHTTVSKFMDDLRAIARSSLLLKEVR